MLLSRECVRTYRLLISVRGERWTQITISALKIETISLPRITQLPVGLTADDQSLY